MTTENPYDKCRKKVYEYEAPWDVFSLAWSNATAPTDLFRLAVGSYIEKYANSVHVRSVALFLRVFVHSFVRLRADDSVCAPQARMPRTTQSTFATAPFFLTLCALLPPPAAPPVRSSLPTGHTAEP